MNANPRVFLTLVVYGSIAALILGCGSSPEDDGGGTKAGGGPTAVSGSQEIAFVDFQDRANVPLTPMIDLPTGNQQLGGVDFRVDAKIMQLRSSVFPQYPRQFTAIPIGRKFKTMNVLHATMGGAYQRPGHPKHEEDGVVVGRYVLHYEDGSQASIPIAYGEDLRGWWDWDKMKPVGRGRVVWTGSNPKASRHKLAVRLYLSSRQNPHPDKLVTSLDFVSEMAKAAPFCVAISLAGASPVAAPNSIAAKDDGSASPRTARTPQQVRPRDNDAAQEKTRRPPANATVPKTKQETKPPARVADTKSKPKEKSFLGPPPQNWAVRVDPPSEAFTFPKDLPYEALSNVSAKFVLYPLGGTAYLAAGKGRARVEAYTVFDLRTGKPVGEASGFRARPAQDKLSGPALSPNGAYLAIHDSSEESLLVGDVRQRKAVAKLTCKASRPAVVFPSNERLVAVDISASKRAMVWELPSGKLLQSFTITDPVADAAGRLVCSPGGRYLALVARGRGDETAVHFYDLASGRRAGVLNAPAGGRVDPRFVAMAFSPDGTEFAALVFGVQTAAFSIGEAMTCWDLETGRLVYQRTLGTPQQPAGILHVANRAEPLQWFPDGRGWLLFQQHVVDRQAARITEQLKPMGEGSYSMYGSKVLDDERVMISGANNTFLVVDVRRTPTE